MLPIPLIQEEIPVSYLPIVVERVLGEDMLEYHPGVSPKQLKLLSGREIGGVDQILYPKILPVKEISSQH